MICLELAALHMFYKSRHANSKTWSLFGLLLYALIGYCLLTLVNSGGNIVSVNATWQMLNVILVSLFGISYYSCKLTGLQTFGLFAAIVSVTTLAYDDIYNTK